MTKNNRLIFLTLFTIIGVLFIDQASKIIVKNNMFLGESISVLGNWFYIHYTENYGMAFGLEFGGEIGKFFLSLFRVIAATLIGYYIYYLINTQKAATGYVIAISLIFAGAVGNIIDSVFYGVIYGYDTWFFGRVVDMLYFPIIQSSYPQWIPVYGGNNFIFFSPVFNIADSAITTGVLMVLIFYRDELKEI